MNYVASLAINAALFRSKKQETVQNVTACIVITI